MLLYFVVLMVLHIWNARQGDCQPEPSESVKLRLVNGSSPCEGRLEIKYKGHWGTVQGYLWDQNDATVVCRQLSCGAALKALGDAQFGEGSGPVYTAKVRCVGNETALQECKSDPWGDNGSPHVWDAAVICEDHRAARLVSGNDECSGRLEIQFGATWGTVCDLHLDRNDANVVCNQLQCGVVVSVLGVAYFGEGNGSVWNNALECQGNESTLYDCPYSSLTHHCNHKNDVGLTCSGKHGPRLVGGIDRCSGRVEVLHGAHWGTLCNEFFSLEDAGVICEQLQCGAVNPYPRVADFGQGNGLMWKDNYRCLGNETQLADCPVSAWGQNHCSQENDAIIFCSNESLSVRLSDGGSRCDGRVEVYENDSWRRVQAKYWNTNVANVVCRQLRCGSAISAYNLSIYHGSQRPVSVIGIQCEGSERHLQNCRTFMINQSSSHINEPGVLCSGHLQIRLSGEDTCAGRLEVYYNGSWGTVCDDSWDMDDANVVCRQLLCGFALTDGPPVYYGKRPDTFWLDEVTCSGNETYLWDCGSAPWGESDCSHKEDVMVTCSESKQLRLANGKHPCEGRVEVWYNGTWGTVCSTEFDIKIGEIICKQLKCGPIRYIFPGSYQYGKGLGPIWLDEIECTSHESTLWQCLSQPWGKHNCDHSYDVGVACQAPGLYIRGGQFYPNILDCFQFVSDTPHGTCFTVIKPEHCRYETNSEAKKQLSYSLPLQLDIPLRLFDGSDNCTGRLEILFNNSWSSVCDDSWDIADAQVVCRQLGCGHASWVPGAVKITRRDGDILDILLDELKCRGSESFLSSCRSAPLGQHDCDHKEDVVVICSGSTMTSTGHSASSFGNRPPSIMVTICKTLGILLIVEFSILVTIVWRQTRRKGSRKETQIPSFDFSNPIKKKNDRTHFKVKLPFETLIPPFSSADILKDGGYSAFVFYQAIYEEIEEIPGDNSFTELHVSEPRSQILVHSATASSPNNCKRT